MGEVMTDKLRARARELAEGAAGQVLNDWPAHQRLISLIEAVILTGMVAVKDGKVITRDEMESRARGLK
jgi:hypothetical protein